MIAHVSGVPVEELVPFAGPAGGLVVLRVWLWARFRARRGG